MAARALWQQRAHGPELHECRALPAGPGSPVTDFAKLPVADIDTAEVLAALAHRKHSAVTYEKVRMRIGKILDFAKYKGLRTGDNPARLDGHLEHEPSRPQIPEVESYKAMPAAELPAFMRELGGIGSNESRALMGTILTTSVSIGFSDRSRRRASSI